MIAIPLLAHLLPLQFVVPWILVLDFSAAIALGGSRQDRQAIHWNEIGWLLPTTVTGLSVGLFLLVNLAKSPLLIGLGLFVIAFGLRSLLFHPDNRAVSQWWSLPTGMLGGTVSAMFGTGGPPYVIYLTHRIRNKRALRATLTGVFFIDNGLRVIIFTITGLLFQENILWACLAGLPVMIFGLYIGHRIHLSISHVRMVRIIGMLLLISGASLLMRAFYV